MFIIDVSFCSLKFPPFLYILMCHRIDYSIYSRWSNFERIRKIWHSSYSFKKPKALNGSVLKYNVQHLWSNCTSMSSSFLQQNPFKRITTIHTTPCRLENNDKTKKRVASIPHKGGCMEHVSTMEPPQVDGCFLLLSQLHCLTLNSSMLPLNHLVQYSPLSGEE